LDLPILNSFQSEIFSGAIKFLFRIAPAEKPSLFEKMQQCRPSFTTLDFR
jgi:hypothetical protein